MDPIDVYLETGKKKIFAGALHWPGWCRSSRDELSALQALIDYGPRYVRVLEGSEFEFQFPADPSGYSVKERLAGNVSTDFGAPAIIPDADRAPINGNEIERLKSILQACWQEFDSAVQKAMGRELRKGPRGGGRDLDKIINHVIDGDHTYLKRLAWKHKRGDGLSTREELIRTRQGVLHALDVAVNEGLPERGPRGGIIWPPRYFIRRVAWHVLDHAWEVEDRII